MGKGPAQIVEGKPMSAFLAVCAMAGVAFLIALIGSKLLTGAVNLGVDAGLNIADKARERRKEREKRK